MDLFEIIPDTTVSSKLFENMLSMILIVAVVRVILVGYVMFGSKEIDVIISKKLAYDIFSLIFNRFMLKSPDIINFSLSLFYDALPC